MKIIRPGGTIGIIGGGQLGRMTALSAANLGYKTIIFTPEKNSPASQVSYRTIVADYADKKALKELAKSVDVITFEFENIPYESVNFLEKLVEVRPGWKSLYISQNRLREKDFINSLGIPTANYAKIDSAASLSKNVRKFGPSILKTTELGYDGKGQYRVDQKANLEKLWKNSGMKIAILEEKVSFIKEISVIVARSQDGRMLCFPATENVHKDGILDTSTAPANISEKTFGLGYNYAKRIADALGLVGLLAVEFFVKKDGSLLVNELAPRPHNSGHWTMDGCITSQFEQFVRAVCGLPFGSIEQTYRVKMKNLIGNDVRKIDSIIKSNKAKIHLYGKSEARPGRKMGHINYIMNL